MVFDPVDPVGGPEESKSTYMWRRQAQTMTTARMAREVANGQQAYARDRASPTMPPALQHTGGPPECCNAGGMVGGAQSEPLGCSQTAAMVLASGGFIVRYGLRPFAAANRASPNSFWLSNLVHLYIRGTYLVRM